MSDDDLLIMRDLIDKEMETSDDRGIGRVDDILAEWREDGSLVLTQLLTGPEALAGRVSRRLRSIAASLLRGRFEHSIPMSEIEEVQEAREALRLRGPAASYPQSGADRWVAEHILRFIPGSGT